MMTLRQFSAEPYTIPTIASWYIADLSKAQGKQELFTHQSPQKLKILREHTLIESTVSSNRIEVEAKIEDSVTGQISLAA
jgi:hypothetical protein